VDLDAGAVFPSQALSECSTALCLFSAAWHGRQDAYWVSKRGLTAKCIDIDQGRLDEMRSMYPAGWTFGCTDAFLWARLVSQGPPSFDVVTLDPFTNHFDRCADMLETWCGLARNVVILGMDERDLDAPDGWQIVNRIQRSKYGGGVYWVVLEPTGTGITPDKVSACLVTRGDQPEQLERIIATLPYDDIVVWDNSLRHWDAKTSGRYSAMLEAKHDVVYFQDDDTLFTHHDKLMAAYEPGRITAVYGHGTDDGGYGDLPLVCGGALADRGLFTEPLRTLQHDPQSLAYADFHVGVLIPFKHVHLPFEINMPVAQHPSRLVNQPWAAEAKRRVTERARQIRDSR
jgi:hypothetical protein